MNSIQMQAFLTDLVDLCDKHQAYINFLEEPVYNFDHEVICYINTILSDGNFKGEYELRKYKNESKYN